MAWISDTNSYLILYNRHMAEILQPKKTCCHGPDTSSKQIVMTKVLKGIRINVTTGNSRLMT